MDQRHSPFCFEQLISAAKYIEKTRCIPDTYLISDESSGDSFANKGVIGQGSTCSSASTSSFGCLSERSSSIPSPRQFPTPPPEHTKRHQPYPSASNARHCRAAHNELEKNRRANLRGYLENLKKIVPAGCDNARNTTLSLLTRARDYILELDSLINSAEERKRLSEKRQKDLRVMLDELRVEKTSTAEEPRPESTSTISAVDDNDYGTGSSFSVSFSSSSAPSNNASCFDLTTKLSVSSNSSSTVSSPIQSYPPFDPYLNGLLPALPLCYPRISMYPYLDVQPL